MWRMRSSIKNHFTVGSCFKIIHFPYLLGGIIHQFNLNSWIHIRTIIHYTGQLFKLFLEKTFGAELKLINTLVLLVWWVAIFIKIRMITTYTLWKVPSDAIDTIILITACAIMSIVHCVVLSPVVIFVIGWRCSIVKLIFGVPLLY